jgi:exodeoxyribonuclease VII large subunit
VRGIELANRLRPALDVLVVGRGGGSIEDLWCFNEESVVRAIFASRLPVVSAVGHEIDVTLSDLVADVRALTPSEAAERVVPSADELLARLAQYQRRMTATLRGRASAARSRVEQLAKSRVLRNPQTLIYDLSHRVDELSEAGQRAVRRRLSQLDDRLSATAARLESLSPLAVLARGYSVTTTLRGEVLRDAAAVSPGDVIRSRLARGEVVSRVENRDASAPVPGEGPRIQ